VHSPANLREQKVARSLGNMIYLSEPHKEYDDNKTRVLPSLILEDAIKISASCCAQVSYRINDNSLDKALKIYDKLITSTPKHFSPFEHQAKASWFSGSFTVDEITYGSKSIQKGITHFDIEGNFWSGNFKNWIQYRQLL